MTSLTAIFGNSEEATAGDSEKLLELYWNRAELKKEFANLREQTFQLKDQVKTQEGRTARMQQKYEQLESLLLDPDWVHNVVVFYQLRALNQICKQRLADFAEKLKQQREQRQHSRLLEEWNNRRRQQAETIEADIEELRRRVQLLEDQLQAERHRFSMMGGLMRFFRKRSIARLLENVATDIASSRQQESIKQSELAKTNALEAPDTQGLSIGDKRSVNLLILSYAQQLYLHYAEDNLAPLLKESGEKSVGAVSFGSRSDCDYLLSVVNDRRLSMIEPKQVPDKLQQRAKLISENAVFNSEDEAVPSTSSVVTVFDIDDNGTVRKDNVDLISENYWDIAKILSR